ncbi:hypothetical protein H8N03_01695 [Ramlibacter sp. USB13]|uniref:Uncharacterized protein n=1 Tax=Ramlibacter cellulosilyticus TaxID=2764187 RepID=A0A923ML58_9BURK|nr:hypothetical protein [Ramlibacter cellulosilyticus]MBC5781637.1 hypothetical protein [Ramlibacter cellulosilyticus]
MDNLHAHAARGETAATLDPASLEASDDLELNEDAPRYCPMRLLARFALLMAGHGRCVITDMMLGDREYAMWQLACARAMDDAELGEVAAKLFAYFDDAQHSGMAVMGTA